MENPKEVFGIKDGKIIKCIIGRTNSQVFIDTIATGVKYSNYENVLKTLVDENNLEYLQSYRTTETILNRLLCLKKEKKEKYDQVMETFFKLSANCNPNAPIKFAILKGDVDLVAELFDKLPDKEQSKESFLKYALLRGNVEKRKHLVRLIIGNDKCSCPPNVLDQDYLLKFLSITALKEDPDIVEVVDLLLKAGNVVDQKDNNGYTALHYSIMRLENLELTKKLIENNADPNIQDCEGNTALHQAVNMKNLEIVKFLMLESKIDHNSKNIYGLSAVQKAMKLDLQNICEFIASSHKLIR